MPCKIFVGNAGRPAIHEETDYAVDPFNLDIEFQLYFFSKLSK